MRFAWLLVVASGCRAILGIDTPEQRTDARTLDGLITIDGAGDAPVVDAPPGAPTAVQAAFNDPPNTDNASSVNVSLKQPVKRGDLIVVAFGVFDTAPAATVTDSLTTGFAPAMATVSTANISESMFYGLAPADGTDTITVRFAKSESFPDVRVAEYAGVSPFNPIDVTTSNTGNNTTQTATLTTNVINDLLVAANYSSAFTQSAGTGFDLRVLSSPDSDLIEDKIAVTSGQYTATAPLSSAGSWAFQLVAFRPI